MNWFQAQFEWFKSFFSETYENGIAGKASSKRVIELGVVWAFLFGFVKIIIYMAISPVPGVAMVVPEIPWNWVTIIVGILGIRAYENLKAAQTAADAEVAIKTGNGKTPPGK